MRVPRTEVELIQCRGGIDLASTTLKIAPGFALDLHNFEPELEGGYRRINGYERGDGRKAPSTAVYYTVVVADSSAIEVDDTLTGDTSGATSKVVIKDDDTNTLGVTNLSGNYTLSEAANGTTITATENQTGQVDPDISDTWQLAAADYYRDLIQPVSGTGDVLGAVQYGGKWYAWRQSGSVAKMYESSASGWVEVALYRRLFFDGGVLAEGDIVAGTAITGATSAATATVKAIVKNAGSYGTDASGYLVVDVTSGAFQDDEDIEVSAVTKAVADGVDEAISFTVGGQFEFIVHNFYGSSGTTYLYGADGVSPAFQFDGTLVVPIYSRRRTRMPAGTPRSISVLTGPTCSCRSLAGSWRIAVSESRWCSAPCSVPQISASATNAPAWPPARVRFWRSTPRAAPTASTDTARPTGPCR